jgi:GntR family transcriptional regulator, transcriptional repressor for pyruvate dehydrogenase complex
MTGQTSFIAPSRTALLACLADPKVTRISVPYHRAIPTVIKERDLELARTAMVDHLEVAARTYGADFDGSLESVARRQLAQLHDPGMTPDEARNGA